MSSPSWGVGREGRGELRDERLHFGDAQQRLRKASLEHASVGADMEENLAAIATWPAPLDALVPFLRGLAGGALPAVPPSLPRELADELAQVLALVEQARAA